jgi:type I restriction enzyme, R subunit
VPPPTSNFAFLSAHDAQLVQLGVRAEHYFRDDPATSLIKLRQFAELLSRIVAAHHAVLDERDSFDEVLRCLSYDRVIPRDIADIFHTLRKFGNDAAHEDKGSHGEALTGLRLARQLGVWFHRTYAKKPDFKPGPFIPPPEPADATAPLREEIAALKRRAEESEDAAARARQESEEHARARESIEDRLRQQAEDSRLWQQLAEQAEADKADLAARLAGLGAIHDAQRRELALSAALAVKVDDPAGLETIQAAAEHALPPEMAALVESGAEAAAKIDLDEAETRAIIDARLSDRGWEADTKTLRHGNGTRPVKGRNLAIAEWPTAHGPADCALFAGLTLVGIAEAKRRHKDVSSVIDQAERYSCGVAASADFVFAGGPWTGGQWGDYKVPFVFSTNGRPYLKQVETKSGIWHRDVRRPVGTAFEYDRVCRCRSNIRWAGRYVYLSRPDDACQDQGRNRP